jgi:tetratricopeptide (TPR) repeat protein
VGIAATLGFQGEVALYQGDSGRAFRLGEESLRLRQELGNPREIAWSLELVGRAALAQGELAAARSLFEQMLAVGQSEFFDRSRALCCLGTAALEQGDRERARAYYGECLALRAEPRPRLGLAGSLEGLARIAQADGRPGRAARWFGAAQALRDGLCDPRTPHEQAAYEGSVRALRSELGEAAYQAAWTEGQQASVTQSVEDALGAV